MDAPLTLPLSRPGEVSNRALLVALLFFGVLLLVLVSGDRVLQDPDTYWQTTSGASIWRTGEWPRTDALSHTFSGAPWIAKEWLSQLILFAGYNTAGWAGLVLSVAVVAAATFAALFAWLSYRVQPTAAFALTSLALLLTASQVLARPNIFLPALLLVWTGGLLASIERGGNPPWALIPVMALWANLHASFPIAFLIAGLLGLEAVASAQAGERARAFRLWCMFGLGCVGAACVTPYGYQSALIGVRVFGSGEAFRHTSEWQPMGLDGMGVLAWGATLSALALLAAAPRRNLFRLIVVALCGYLMLRHVRFAGLFGIVATMTVAGPLASRFPALAARPMEQMGTAIRLGAMAGIAILAGAATLLSVSASPSPSTAITPAAALAAARQIGVRGPVYNDFDFGGYMVWAGVPSFVDGRTDQLFVDGFLDELNATLAHPAPSRFLAFIGRYGVTWAVVKPGSAEARHFAASPEWSAAFKDGGAVLFVRTPAELADLRRMRAP